MRELLRGHVVTEIPVSWGYRNQPNLRVAENPLRIRRGLTVLARAGRLPVKVMTVSAIWASCLPRE